jgi:hypothetical protein
MMVLISTAWVRNLSKRASGALIPEKKWFCYCKCDPFPEQLSVAVMLLAAGGRIVDHGH